LEEMVPLKAWEDLGDVHKPLSSPFTRLFFGLVLAMQEFCYLSHAPSSLLDFFF
jgi:hypothetical protein